LTSQAAGRSPPLALYVHWPYCARICPYCDFNVVRDRGQAEQSALIQAIVDDMQGQAALIGPRDLVSIFFGGGTPSLMDPAWVDRIVQAARSLWPGAATPEISLEANPTDAEAGRFAGFAAAGVSRLSLGVQALDDTALRFLGRNHDAAEARRALTLARSAFPRLSLDLIYARPGQTPADWAAELRQAIGLGAEHISPYQLTIEQGTAFHRAIGRGVFAPLAEEASAALYETAQSVLTEAGFDAYEVSNHARGEAARSRHNLAYWRGEDYLGVGPGAHGRLTIGGQRIATYAAPRVADYIAAVSRSGLGLTIRETLSPREAAIERLLLGLRIDAGVRWDEVAALDLSLTSETVRDLVGQGLAHADATGLRATRAGRAVLDSLVAALARVGA
jgi:putative oxygen-independent coproporphyrinogen III oxidase